MRREERLDRPGRAVEGGRMRKLQPGRHGQGRGELGAGQWILELGAGQCRNELTNCYDPKQKAVRRVEEKSRAFPPMGPRVDGPAGPRRMGGIMGLQVTSELEVVPRASKCCPGFLGIPILKGVVGQLLAFKFIGCQVS